MSVTGLVFIAIFLVGLVLTLYHPIYGILLYFFEWHNHPPYWWWGEGWPDLRWSLLIAVLTVVSLLINKKKLEQLSQMNYKPFIWLVLMVINSYMVSMIFAISPADSYRKTEILFKLATNYLLMIYVIRNPRDYQYVILIILLGVANFGRIAWEEGSNRDLGVIAPGATSGNLIAAYMMSIVPFYAITFFQKNRWLKVLVIITLPFVLNALILENSRSTILGLATMGILMPVFLKGKTRFKAIVGLICGGLLFFYLTNPQFWERQSTTVNYEQDNSAMSRFYLWKGAYNFLKDHPFGGGGESFESLSYEYVPELREAIMKKGTKTVHNTYLDVATEWGYLGLFLYLGWLIQTGWVLFRIRRDLKKMPDDGFFNLHSAGIILALVSSLVAGIFSSRQYAENIYWFSTFAIALRNVQLNQMLKLRYQNEEEQEQAQSIEPEVSI